HVGNRLRLGMLGHLAGELPESVHVSGVHPLVKLAPGGRGDRTSHQLCHLNCCGLRTDSCEIITLTSAGPLNAIAWSSALLRSFGFSTNQPLPPNASIIRS